MFNLDISKNNELTPKGKLVLFLFFLAGVFFTLVLYQFPSISSKQGVDFFSQIFKSTSVLITVFILLSIAELIAAKNNPVFEISKLTVIVPLAGITSYIIYSLILTQLISEELMLSYVEIMENNMLFSLLHWIVGLANVMFFSVFLMNTLFKNKEDINSINLGWIHIKGILFGKNKI